MSEDPENVQAKHHKKNQDNVEENKHSPENEDSDEEASHSHR